jgi:hypothetical protein
MSQGTTSPLMGVCDVWFVVRFEINTVDIIGKRKKKVYLFLNSHSESDTLEYKKKRTQGKRKLILLKTVELWDSNARYKTIQC